MNIQTKVAGEGKQRNGAGTIAGVFLTPHTPRYCTYDAALRNKLAHPNFQMVRDGLVAQGRSLAEIEPDVIIVNSCHLVSTFPVVVDGTPRHRGVLTAQEAPEMIFGVEYDFPGDLELAAAIVDRGTAAGEMGRLANDIHFPLDYGTVMPVVLYLDRSQTIPVVPISVCLLSDLPEAFRWGQHIARAVRELGRRAAYVASGSGSHKLVRGPEKWPSEADQELDHRAAAMLRDGDYEKLWTWLPEYAQAAGPEMKGRHLAMMLGVLLEAGHGFRTELQAYGPSSGSGNYVISMAAG